LKSDNGHDIGNSRSRSGALWILGILKFWADFVGVITPANYDDCQAGAAGVDSYSIALDSTDLI
jgi:hypothetical protein